MQGENGTRRVLSDAPLPVFLEDFVTLGDVDDTGASAPDR
jgi:hypothetical protein